MKFLKVIFTILVLFSSFVYSFEIKCNPVEKIKWKNGETFIEFLKKYHLPLKLYYDLSGEDKKIITQIIEGTTGYVAKDCCGNINQAVIPLNEELEIHIFKDISGKYKLEIIPINYLTKKKKEVITIKSSFLSDIVKKTHNYPLALNLQRILKSKIKFSKLKKGDKLGVIYIDKSWMGEKFGSQKVLALYFLHGKKKIYQFLYKGRYYDEKAKVRKQVSTFILPCRYRRISDGFTKKRWHPILHIYRPHNGIDYANKIGTPIHATYSGVVKYAGWVRGYGKYIEIKHPRGYVSVYGHLSKIRVKVGQRVKRGQLIGNMGSTGLSTGSHLHFGIKLNGIWINPANKIVIVKDAHNKLRRKILAVVRKYKKELDALK